MTNEQKIGREINRHGPFIHAERFSWEIHSEYLAKYCPQYFNPDEYNWTECSEYLAKYCPQHFDSDKYDWEYDSWAVVQYCPEKFDINKANLKNIIKYLPEYRNMSLEEIKQKAILNKI